MSGSRQCEKNNSAGRDEASPSAQEHDGRSFLILFLYVEYIDSVYVLREFKVSYCRTNLFDNLIHIVP